MKEDPDVHVVFAFRHQCRAVCGCLASCVEYNQYIVLQNARGPSLES